MPTLSQASRLLMISDSKSAFAASDSKPVVAAGSRHKLGRVPYDKTTQPRDLQGSRGPTGFTCEWAVEHFLHQARAGAA